MVVDETAGPSGLQMPLCRPVRKRKRVQDKEDEDEEEEEDGDDEEDDEETQPTGAQKLHR